MSLSIRALAIFALSTIVPVCAWCQESPPPANSQPASQSASQPAQSEAQAKDKEASKQQSGVQGQTVPGSSSTQGKVEGTSNDRLFYTLPNFLTLENGGQVPALTTGQKYKVVARGSFDYIQIPWYGFLAGISEAENSEPGFGQGAQGYAKRFGSAFADGTIENFMTGAVLPSLLHQDPRFFQSGKGSFTRRTGYAVSRIFVTRTDSGGQQFNYSEIVGSALSAAISTSTYHPRAFITKRYDPTTGMVAYIHNNSDRTLTNTLSVWGTQVGYDTITIVVKEFWPDIHRKLSHKQRGDFAPAGNSPK
jgi:hypothetical protein